LFSHTADILWSNAIASRAVYQETGVIKSKVNKNQAKNEKKSQLKL